MANSVNNAGSAGEANNSGAVGENNTWNNAMAQVNNDYDWGGEEDWSKVSVSFIQMSLPEIGNYY